MNTPRQLLMVLLPVVFLGACTTLSEQDKATLTTASQKADQALSIAQQALDAARKAQATADQAAQNAAQAAKAAADAAASAQAANEKADRMFQRSLRK